jgi:hypothetical protein
MENVVPPTKRDLGAGRANCAGFPGLIPLDDFKAAQLKPCGEPVEKNRLESRGNSKFQARPMEALS